MTTCFLYSEVYQMIIYMFLIQFRKKAGLETVWIWTRTFFSWTFLARSGIGFSFISILATWPAELWKRQLGQNRRSTNPGPSPWPFCCCSLNPTLSTQGKWIILFLFKHFWERTAAKPDESWKIKQDWIFLLACQAPLQSLLNAG